jgi:predicted RecA/RadA family phage recombinase
MKGGRSITRRPDPACRQATWSSSGDFIGVAADDIADGQTGALLVEGVFKMPAPGDTAFSAGDTVDWDGSTIIATAGSPVGKVVKDCATADTIAWVKLTP